jgi:PAS domain S-box-containing protein
MNTPNPPNIADQVRRELAETRARLALAEETLEAIRCGEVDGLVITGPEGRRVFTVQGAQEPYRLLIEQMSEGALTLSREGFVLYANLPMARLLGTPLERVIGAEFRAFVRTEDQPVLAGLVTQAWEGSSRGVLYFCSAGGLCVPVRLGLSRLELELETLVCVVVTDLTESRKKEDELQLLHADLERRVAERTAELATAHVAALDMAEEAVEARRQIEQAMAKQRRAEEEQRQRIQCDIQLAVVLVALSREAAKSHTDLIAPLRRITEQVAKTLGMARVSVWRCNAACDAIHCMDLFELHTGQHSSGAQLTLQDYPAYFAAMAQSDIIAADDAHADPRTREFAESYLRPLGISSMLDTAIRIHGKPSGVVCHEHTGPARHWTADEQSFAVAIANLVSQVFEAGERAEIEVQLRLEAAALAAAANAIVITDRHGIIQWANPAFTKTTGYTLEEAVGQNARLLQSGKHDAAFYHQLWATILGGGVWSGEMVNRRKDGSLFTEEAVITPVQDDRGEITHFVAIKQDVTEKKLLEQKFLRSQRMEAIGSLAGGIAHDLNNALAPVLMAAELLKMSSTSPETDRMLDTIQDSTQRGANMVKQILTFARGSADDRGLIQPKHLIKEMIEIARHTFPKRIQIRPDLTPDTWVVRGNPTQLHQILLNMCVNARDAMPAGGTLTLASGNVRLDAACAMLTPDARPGPYVLLTVTDTGMGMPPEVRARIFDPFFTTKEEGRGTGLGLSTVARIVKEHGGFITVDSKVGRGATFKVYLPAAETADAAAVHTAPPALPGGKGELILVVDDESAICAIATQTLQMFGYQVVTAKDGVEGLSAYMQHRDKLELVITDMAMPIMDGAAMIRVLQNIAPRLKIIVTSGIDPGSKRAIVSVSGTQAFIAKPYSAEQLLVTVDSVLHPPTQA